MIIGLEPEALRDPHADRLDRWKSVPAVAPMNT
jgi:hypothetical protein